MSTRGAPYCSSCRSTITATPGPFHQPRFLALTDRQRQDYMNSAATFWLPGSGMTNAQKEIAQQQAAASFFPYMMDDGGSRVSAFVKNFYM